MIEIDKSKCVDCGACISACPMKLFRKTGDEVTVKDSKWCLSCGHCAAACAAQAVVLNGRPSPEGYPATPEGMLETLITRRRSIRHYTPQLPQREDIQWALDVAEYAPSAKNLRPYRWIVVWGKERCDALAQELIDWGAEQGFDSGLVQMKAKGENLVTCGAPCVLVCCGPKGGFGSSDGVIAQTTLNLLLEQKGYGSCWAGYLQVLMKMREESRTQLGMAANEMVYSALMVGHPAPEEHYCQLPYRAPAKVTWQE